MKLGKKKAEEQVVGEEQKTKKGVPWFGRFLKRHKKFTFFLVVVVIGSVATVVVFNRKGNKMPSNVPTASAFQTTTLEKRDISNSISVTGTIASADSRTLTTTLSNIDVKTLNVAVGDYVTAGDVLVVFDDSDLSEELADAKSSLSISKQQTANSLETAQRSYDEATESATIQANRAASNVNSAYTTYTEAVATEASSKTAYQKAVEAEKAAEKAANTQQEKIEKLQKEISELEKELKSAAESEKASIQKKITKKQESLTLAKQAYETKSATLKEAQQDAATAKQAYEQAGNALEQAGSSYTKAVQEQEDTTRNNKNNLANQASSLENTKLNAANGSKNEEKQVENLQEQISSCTVTAPISGVITSLLAKAEETFAGGEILVIQDSTNFIVEANVDEYDIADVEKGMTVVIKTDATGDEELEGEVIYVAPTPSDSTGSAMGGATSSGSSSYEVQISIKTSNERLRIGMSAKASILTASKEDVFAVPYDVIETNADGETVIYVVDGVGGNRGGFPGKGKDRTSSETESTQREAGTEETTTKEKEVSDVSNSERQDMSNGEIPEMGNGEMPDMSNGERPEMRNGEMLNGQRQDGSSSEDNNMTQNRREIVVEVGLESDYYTEIISDELEEGMLVITGTSMTKSSANEDSRDMSSIFGGAGGGRNGNMGSGGMSGGMPGGGGRP